MNIACNPLLPNANDTPPYVNHAHSDVNHSHSDVNHVHSDVNHARSNVNHAIEDIFYYTVISKCLEPYFLFVILVIILRIFGPRFYYIKRYQIMTKLKNKYKDTLYLFDGEVNPGLFVNYKYWFCGYKEDGDDDNDIIYLMCSKQFYDELSKDDSKKEEHIYIDTYICSGSYKKMTYYSNSIDVTHLEPNENQKNIIDDIILKFNQKKHLVVTISGPSGSGKSTIGLLLAKQIKGSYTNTFDPTEPGNSLVACYSCTGGDPFIIVIEEFDTLIKKIHDEKCHFHKDVATPVRNKTTWNRMLDDIDRGLYPNLIIILTSNTDIKNIDDLDPSYLRKGRCNTRYTLENFG